ncbi:YadA-like family protein [Alcaligenaceae bacterium]|nr:YadA-like family protein [Alcaligenaceae bacterium]
MNRIYRTLWNEQTGTYVAVPEIAKSRGKRSGSSVGTGARGAAPAGAWTLTLCALALMGAGLLGGGQVAFAQALTGNSLAVTGNATVGGDLTVDGKSTFEDDLDVKKKLTVAGATSLQAVTAQTLGVTGATALAGTLSVAGQSTLGALTAGTTTLSGLTVTGGTTQLAGLNVTGATTLAGLTASGTSALAAVTANTLTMNGGGPVISQSQIDMKSKKIVNVANGTNAADAVNKGQLDTVSAAANRGWDLKASGTGGVATVKPGDTVTVTGGQNIDVTRSGAELTVKTKDNISATTLTSTGATTVGGPLTVAGQTTLNGGLNVGGTKITNVGNGNVAAGSTDAINAGQVYHLLNEEGKGIKYFRANSTKPDAQAAGVDSIAIGPDSVSGGTGSFAAGHNARTSATNAVAVGANSNASATGALAAGTGAKASGGKAAAIGAGAIAEGVSSVAVGDGAKALTPTDGSDPVAAIAIGKDSVSSGVGSTAIGHQASASGGNTLAFGTSATASGANGIALGEGAEAGAQNNISIGSAAGLGTTSNLPNDRSHNIAIGAQSGQNVKGQFNVTMGDQAGSGVDGNENVAFGRQAGVGVDGDANVSIGTNANTGRTANRAVSIGEDSKSETEGVAIGYLASAGNTGVALGRQTTALGTGTAVGPNAHADSGHVALGLNSQATQADVSGSSAFTNRSFSGSAVSVGSSDPGGVFTRRIVNVEDGAQETDAVNVRQLQQAVSGISLSDIDFAGGVINNLQTQIDQNMQEYVSINDGGTDKGNKNNNGAAAIDSIAIGPDATTKNRDAIAIGHMAGAEGDSAVVLGHNIKGLGKNSTTVGNSQSEARGESGVAIGTHVISRDENSIVIGRDSYTDRQGNGPSVKNSIVIGTASTSTAVEGIVIGKDSVVNAARGIAQGSAAHATAANAMAFGTDAHGAGVDSQASGTGAGSYAERGIALGAKARSGQENPNVGDLGSNRDSIAIGSDSVAEMNSSIATGREAKATANFAQALGYKAQASGVESIAQGSSALALGQQAMAMGTGAQSTAASAMAMGTGAQTTAASAMAMGTDAQSTAGNAIAMGAGAQSTAAGAVAIGRGATAGNGRSVALGDGAATDGPVDTTNATLNNLTYGTFAGTAPIATVSVGTAGEKRTITNVAAGRISGTSTDAINGSQLYATNAVLGNVANTTKQILGGNAALNPNGSLSMTDIGNTGKDNVHDAIKYAAQGWNLSTNSGVASNVAPGGKVDLANTDGNIKIAQAGGNVQFNLADDVKVKNDLTVGGDTAIAGNTTIAGMTNMNGGATISKSLTVNPNTNVNFGGNKITNVAAGTADTDGVNVSQLNTVKNSPITFAGNTGSVDRKLGETQIIRGSLANTAAASSDNIRTQVNAAGDMEILLAKNLTADSLSINNGGPVINNTGINMGGKKITNLAKGTDGTDAVNVDQLTEVSDVANKGWNLSTNNGVASNVAPGGKVDLANTDGNIKIAQAGGNVQFNLADDVKVKNDLTVGGDTTIAGMTNMNGGATISKSLTVNPNTNVNFGGNKITNVAAGTADTDGVNVSQLNTLANKPLTFKADAGADLERRLGDSVAINGADSNISTTTTPEGVDIALAKDLKLGPAGSVTMGNTLVNNAGLTITGGPSVTVGGIYAGDKKITNVTAGTAPTDAVNVSQLTDQDTALTTKGLDFSGNTGADVHRDLGTKLAIKGDATTASTYSGANLKTVTDPANGAINIQMAEAPEFKAVTTNDLTVNNNLSVKNGATINMGGNKITNVAAGTDKTDAVNVGQLDNVSDVANAGWNVSSNSGTTTNNISPNGNVDFRGDSNVTIAQTGADDDAVLQVKLNPDLAVTSVTTGNTVMNTGGITINNGANGPITLTNDGLKAGTVVVSAATGIHAGDKKITNVTAGVADTDAVNVSQLKNQDTALTAKGLDFSGNTGGDVHRDLGTTLAIKGDATTAGTYSGANLKTVTDPANGAINIQMAEAPEFKAVTTNDLTVNNNLSVKNGATINMGGNKITNVAAGTDKTDAVNVGQLEDVDATANKGWHLTASGANSSNVKPDGKVDLSPTDGNIVITKAGTDNDIKFALADDLNVGTVNVNKNLTVKGDTNLGDTFYVTPGAITVAPATTINMGGNKITNVAKAENNGEVVVYEQLGELDDTLTKKGMNFAGNTGVDVHRDLGTTLAIKGNATTAGTYSGANLKTVTDPANGAINIQMAEAPEFKAVTTNDLTVNNNLSVKNGATINMGHNKITNVAAGTDKTDAVNLGQLDDVSDVANAGWHLTANGASSTNVKPTETVDLTNATDNNIVVSKGTETNPHQVRFGLADNVTIANNLKVGGNSEVAGNATIGGNTSIGGSASIAGAMSVAGASHLAGGATISEKLIVSPNTDINMGGNKVHGVAAGTADTDGVNVSQLNTLANKPLTFKADAGADLDRKLGETVAIKGADSNISTTTTPDGVNIALAKNLNLGPTGSVQMGNTLVDNNGLTIAGGPSVTLAGGVNAGGKVISNVAPGVAGTDGVNVNQLKDVDATANKGWHLTATGANSSNVKPDGKVDLSPTDGNIVITKVDTDNDIKFALADDLNLGTVNVNKNLTVKGDTNLGDTFYVTPGAITVAPATTINMGGNKITNVAKAENNGEVVVYEQLGELDDTLTKKGMNFSGNRGADVHRDLGTTLAIKGVASTAGAYTGANIRTVTDPASGAINILMAKAPVFDAVTTEDLTVNQNLTVKKGANIDMGGNKITNVKAGTNKLDAVNFGQLKKVDETANKGWHLTATGANSSNVKPDGKVDLSPTDGNIVITKVDTDNDIKFALADDLNLGTVNVNKNLTVKGDTNLGDTFYVKPGEINVAPATTINMGGNKITNVAKAENNGEVVVYEQLGELDDTLTKKGMNFAGNKGADVHRDLGTTLAIKGAASTAGGYSGANIKTVTDPATGAINIRMAKAPVFDAVTTEDLTVNQNLTVKNGATINMGGNKVTNVAAGTDKTDAVNLGQLDDVSDVANAGWHLTANGADSTNVKPSDKVDLTNATDNNIVVSKGPATDPHQVRFGLADNVTIANNLTVTNNANVGGALNVTGLASLSGGAHISKELIVSPNTDINMGGNKVHGVDAGTADTDAVNVSQLNTLANKPLTFKADAGADLDRKLGETVAITGADSNISTTTNPDGLSIALAKNLDLGAAGSVQMGDTLINGTGLTILGGPNITLAGINAGNKVITNVAPGVAGTDAVNVNQLNKVDETANKGWHISASGANSSNVKPDGKVDLSPTDGNIIIEKLATDNDIKFALADDLNLGTVNVNKNLTVKGDTNLGDTFYVTPGAINVAGGTTINMGGNKITNVAKAENNGDVVVYEQLGELDDAVTTKGLNFAGNEGADVHRDLGTTLAIQGGATTAGAYSGANLKTVTDPVTGAINIQMAEAPEFKAVATNDLTVNKSLTVKHGATINMGGNKVTNVAAGTDKTDAVNVGQLDDVSEVANRGWNLKADGKNESNVAPGGTVDLANTDKNIVIEKDATDPNKVLFNLAREISIDQVTTGNTVMNTEGITIAGGPNGPISLTNQGLTAGSVIISSISGINAGGHKITNVAAGTALTDAVNVSQLKDVQQNVDDLGDRAVKYDGKAGDPKNQITLEDTKSLDGGKTGGTTISNLAQGEVSKNSTEAINGSQLHDMGEQVAGSLGGNSKFVGGKLVTELNVGGNSYNNVNDALVGLNTDLENVSNVANAGWNVQTNGGDASKVAPGKTVNFKDGQNIKITNDGLNITVATADHITVKSVTASKVTAEEVAIKDGPTINKGGIDMHDKRITNLAAGVDDKDAVNVSQLNKATGDLNSRVDNLSGKVNQVDNRASAGIAAALATAGLPQAYLPGKSMFSVAGGTWRGETGYAMGLSTVSDNGKWVVKGSATSSSRGDYGGSVGVGYQW